MPRQPEPISPQFVAVEDVTVEVRAAEVALRDARERRRVALVAAHDAGASITLLAKTVGLTHQRVSQIISTP